MLTKEKADILIKRRHGQRIFFLVFGGACILTGINIALAAFFYVSNLGYFFPFFLTGLAMIVIGSVFMIIQYTVIKSSKDHLISMWNGEAPGIESTSNFEIKN